MRRALNIDYQTQQALGPVLTELLERLFGPGFPRHGETHLRGGRDPLPEGLPGTLSATTPNSIGTGPAFLQGHTHALDLESLRVDLNGRVVAANHGPRHRPDGNDPAPGWVTTGSDPAGDVGWDVDPDSVGIGTSSGYAGGGEALLTAGSGGYVGQLWMSSDHGAAVAVSGETAEGRLILAPLGASVVDFRELADGGSGYHRLRLRVDRDAGAYLESDGTAADTLPLTLRTGTIDAVVVQSDSLGLPVDTEHPAALTTRDGAMWYRSDTEDLWYLKAGVPTRVGEYDHDHDPHDLLNVADQHHTGWADGAAPTATVTFDPARNDPDHVTDGDWSTSSTPADVRPDGTERVRWTFSGPTYVGTLRYLYQAVIGSPVMTHLDYQDQVIADTGSIYDSGTVRMTIPEFQRRGLQEVTVDATVSWVELVMYPVANFNDENLPSEECGVRLFEAELSTGAAGDAVPDMLLASDIGHGKWVHPTELLSKSAITAITLDGRTTEQLITEVVDTVLADVAHNDLTGLQGGAADDYQHLTTAQVSALHAPVTVTDTASIDLTLTGQALSASVNYAGPGSASTAARSDHTHSGVYEPVIAAGTTGQFLRGDKSWTNTLQGSLRLEHSATPLVFRETDQTLPAGLWRVVTDAGGFRLDRNTAAAGDFSTYTAPISVSSTDAVSLPGSLSVTGTTTLATSLNGVLKATSGVVSASAAASDLSGWPAAVSMTEVGYLDGVTSALQTQLDGKVPTTRTITAGSGLTGGGDLSANRTLAVSWGGTGSASTAARSDHNHSGTYEPANANIQAHIASTSNPHSVTKTQVGLGNVLNVAQVQLQASTPGSAQTGHLNINGTASVGALSLSKTLTGNYPTGISVSSTLQADVEALGLNVASLAIGHDAQDVSWVYGIRSYGSSFTKATTGTITNAASLYLTVPTIATNNYALYVLSGTSYLGGSVGIGTSGPSTALDVMGGLLSTNYPATMITASTNGYAQDMGGALGFQGKYNAAGAYAILASVQGAKENATDGNYAGTLRLLTRAHGAGSLTERMRITSGGNVGIGTTAALGSYTPTLSLAGSEVSTSASQIELRGYRTAADAGLLGRVSFHNALSTATEKRVAQIDAYAGGDVEAGNLRFLTANSAGTVQETLRIANLTADVYGLLRVTGSMPATSSVYGAYLAPTLTPTEGGLGAGVSVVQTIGSAATNVGDAIGLYVPGSSWTKGTTGTVARAYGLYVSPPTLATSNYAVYVSSGTSAFGGSVGFGGITAPSESIHTGTNLRVDGTLKLPALSNGILKVASGAVASGGAASDLSGWPAGVSMTEVGYLDGVTSAIQTQINNKVSNDRQVIAGTGLTGGGMLGSDVTLSANFGTTAGTIAQGNHTHTVGSLSDWPWAVSTTEVGYLDGVTSAIQTQLNGKLNNGGNDGVMVLKNNLNYYTRLELGNAASTESSAELVIYADTDRWTATPITFKQYNTSAGYWETWAGFIKSAGATNTLDIYCIDGVTIGPTLEVANGISATITIPKLTSGGANGSLTISGGIITAATNPT